MAILPQKFPLQNSAVASYDFFDIAEGTGIVTFYGEKIATAAATYAYILTGKETVWSETDGWTAALSADLDFDVTFNLSKIISGDAYLNIPLYANSAGTRNVSATVTLIKVTGGVETIIGAAQTTNTVSGSSGGAPVSGMVTMKWTIARTPFSKNDKLRLTVAGNVTGSAGTDGIGHSPLGTQSTTTNEEFNTIGTSRMTLYVPFVIDL